MADIQQNFLQAMQQLQLTPQEQALYQRHLTNLYGPGGVTNADGSRSTLYQMSVEINGKTYNLPTVYDGKIIPPQEAIQRAQAQGLNNFPSYGSEQEAETRYQQMHQYIDKDTAAYFAAHKQPSAPAAATVAPPAGAPPATLTPSVPTPSVPATRLQNLN